MRPPSPALAEIQEGVVVVRQGTNVGTDAALLQFSVTGMTRVFTEAKV